MPQTSLEGRCFAAEAIKAVAPGTRENVNSVLGNILRITLSYPGIRVVEKPQICTHKLPDTHLLKETQFTKAG
jgi:hypothetical protein